jgi:hypothetical protein
MTGTNCDLFTHKQSRSYLNHLLFSSKIPDGQEITNMRNACKVLVEKPAGKEHIIRLRRDDRIILKWLSKEYRGRTSVNLSG